MALPLSAGAVQLTVALPLPGTAATLPGASGTVKGVTLLLGADGALVPTALAATTVKV